MVDERLRKIQLSRVLAGCGFVVTIGGMACQSGDTITLGGSPPGSGGSDSGLLPLTFTDVALVAELSSVNKDDNPTLTSDQLTICFTSDREGGLGDVDVFCSERADAEGTFSIPTAPTEVNSEVFETSSALSLDGLSLYLSSDRGGTENGSEIYVARRASRTSAWSAPVLVPELNSPSDDIPRPPAMGDLVMPLSSRRTDDVYRTYFAERTSRNEAFSSPTLVDELVFSTQSTVDAQLSEDGLLLVFTTAGQGEDPSDLYASERSALGEPFGAPIPIEGANSSFDDRDPWLSPEGSVLYFSSNRDGDFEIYRALRVF